MCSAVAWRRVERRETYQSALAGVHLAALHALNVESRRLPALALALDAHLPVGTLASPEPALGLTAIATRTTPVARLHLNAGAAAGPRPTAVPVLHGVVPEIPRWHAGLAVDRTFPLRATLLGAELVAQRPTVPLHPTVWEATVGARGQLGPRTTFDAGFVRHLTGDDRAWVLRAGVGWVGGLP